MITNLPPFRLEDVVMNSELLHRSSRPPDYEGENNALKALVQTMVTSPQTILQKLVERLSVFATRTRPESACSSNTTGKSIKMGGLGGSFCRPS